jgi:hypothetical protein
MNRLEAEQLTASTFQLLQEAMRGSWTDDTERDKLIEFAKNFDRQVEDFLTPVNYVNAKDGMEENK